MTVISTIGVALTYPRTRTLRVFEKKFGFDLSTTLNGSNFIFWKFLFLIFEMKSRSQFLSLFNSANLQFRSLEVLDLLNLNLVPLYIFLFFTRDNSKWSCVHTRTIKCITRSVFAAALPGQLSSEHLWLHVPWSCLLVRSDTIPLLSSKGLLLIVYL